MLGSSYKMSMSIKETPELSLRADQNSNNCPGVCYVVIHWSFAGSFPIGNNGERKFTTYLVICPKKQMKICPKVYRFLLIGMDSPGT